MAKACKAAGDGCGTLPGWNNGGRCHRCRAAHDVTVKGDYLAALCHHAGDTTGAMTSIGKPKHTTRSWRRDDPAFAAAERAVMTWIESTGIRVRKGGTPAADAQIDRAIELLEQGEAISSAAKAAGVSSATLHNRARSEPRLAAAMAGRRGMQGGQRGSRMSPETAQEIRRLWAIVDLKVDEIATLLSISVPTLYAYRRELGLPMRRDGSDSAGD